MMGRFVGLPFLSPLHRLLIGGTCFHFQRERSTKLLNITNSSLAKILNSYQ